MRIVSYTFYISGLMDKSTKQTLLLAAIPEFAEHGYQKATVRKIVKRSGAKNLNAVVYYYGGKEGLYKAVLDFMFCEAAKFRDEEELTNLDQLSIEDKLASIIRFNVRAYYSVETQLDKDLYSIFVNEASNPTPFLKEIIQRYLRPGRDSLSSLLKEYLGPSVPQSVVEHCEYSISAQILYGAIGWPIISRITPDHPPFGEKVDELSDHIVTFTLSALKGIKDQHRQDEPF